MSKNAEFDAYFEPVDLKSASNSTFFDIHIQNVVQKIFWGHTVLALFGQL
jgi:hypothetical protein